MGFPLARPEGQQAFLGRRRVDYRQYLRAQIRELFVTLLQSYLGTSHAVQEGPQVKNFSIFEQALKYSGVEETENLGEIASDNYGGQRSKVRGRAGLARVVGRDEVRCQLRLKFFF